ncbi:MAG TPA: prephenate dehydratase domain-containing protein [Gemmatimonadaceae bacterium]|nr:prephenate dehydratase domain-containing protein [Gemmatimonadaceae bacterium]
MRPVVAYQGEPGAFSEEAIVALWGSDVAPLSCATFDDVTRAVQEGRARFGMLPVENSIAGPVRDSIASIAASRLTAVGATELPIRLCLLALPGATIESLRSVESHPVALRQCREYLDHRPWLRVREAFDTAGAARNVAAARDATRAAIASARAGELTGLVALAEGIEDRAGNVTRFTIVAREPAALPSRALDPGRARSNLKR